MLNKKFKILFLLILLLVFVSSRSTNASIIDSLKSKIQEKADSIKKLEQEIFNYKSELSEVEVKAKNLQEDIKSLDSAKNELDGNIKKTEKDINKTTSTIEEIELSINDKEERIKKNYNLIEKMLINLHQEDGNTLIEKIMQEKSISYYSEYIENLEKFKTTINEQISELSSLKMSLLSDKEKALQKKNSLANLKKELSGKKVSVQETQKQKDSLLKQTKNVQSTYQKIIEDKLALKNQFEQEMFNFESELKLTIDQSKLPGTKNSTLYWPLESVRITQYFGSTVAAKRLYVSGSHNGIDLGAKDGTKVMAGLSGTVWATGNTDLKKGCYSYGKWILIKHENGLSTLYGHLSSQIVKAGDTVTTGSTIGFSGRTGYVTGPHLHFTVLATEGTRVMEIPSEKTVNCRGVTIPIADPKAYLDPMLYLPKI